MKKLKPTWVDRAEQFCELQLSVGRALAIGDEDRLIELLAAVSNHCDQWLDSMDKTIRIVDPSVDSWEHISARLPIKKRSGFFAGGRPLD